MKKYIVLLLFIVIPYLSNAHLGGISGKVFSKENESSIFDANISISFTTLQAKTDYNGAFSFANLNAGTYILDIQKVGYKTQQIKVVVMDDKIIQTNIYLETTAISLSEVKITADKTITQQLLGKYDLALRPVVNSQEILRIVPGLFIGQHQGGGKAEQFFLRGFDIDHGTDIQLTADGMPVNMVSHAHGQGYADMHFIIPETIASVDYGKGPYSTNKGNFATAGWVDLKTQNTLEQNQLKIEMGQFKTARILAMANLFNINKTTSKQSAYAALEYNQTNGFFENSQDFKRFNIFAKYHAHFGEKNEINASISNFKSSWAASGQIPDRAVANNQIGFFGAIDPNEGGSTGRSNVQINWTSNITQNSQLNTQVYGSSYDFDLFSNFSFFLLDSLNGDQIRQAEQRKIMGINSNYLSDFNFFGKKSTLNIGLNFRHDFLPKSLLWQTLNKTEILQKLQDGEIKESNVGIYVSQKTFLNPQLNIELGIRYDFLKGYFKNNIAANTNSKGGLFLPKINIDYKVNTNLQFFAKTGLGYHSNDSRVAVKTQNINILQPVFGADLGMVFKPTSTLIFSPTLWYLYSKQEFVYVGDEAIVEAKGASRRVGLELSTRWNPVANLYFDYDLTLAKPRIITNTENGPYIPLAPVLTQNIGITYNSKSGLSGSIRARQLSDRPANESNTIIANGYFITDIALNYPIKKVSIGLFIQNVFNQKWKETQFLTESRLKQETEAVEEIHFTPGTPFNARLTFNYSF